MLKTVQCWLWKEKYKMGSAMPQRFFQSSLYLPANSTGKTTKVKKIMLSGKALMAMRDQNNKVFGPKLIKSLQNKTTPSDIMVNEEIIGHRTCIDHPTEHSSNESKNLQYISSEQPISESVSDLDKTIKNNTKWTDVPSLVDLSSLTSFPLMNPNKGNASNLENPQSISFFEGGYKKIPSITKILEQTMPPEQRQTLIMWEKKMIAKLGEEEFQKYKQSLIETGTVLHGCIEQRLKDQIEPSSYALEPIEKYWKSLRKALPSFSEVQLTESRVVHPYMHYQGAIDCFATYRKKRLVIEFKTSSRPKLTLQSTYDYPLQLAAYMGALNYDPDLIEKTPEADGALIVIAYPTGREATIHHLDENLCQLYWNRWKERLLSFWEMELK